jgi:crossover junction endodeoxyribonuclease RuvC
VLAAAGLPVSGGDRAAAVDRRSGSPPSTGRRASPSRAVPPRKGLGSSEIVLGIDPGTLVVGYGAIEARQGRTRFLTAGVIRLSRGKSVPVRLGEIQRRITAILEEIRPSSVVVERAFASRNVQSALRIGEGRGVALACAAAFGADVIELAPAVAKKSLVGHGAADKSQVARMVAAVLGLSRIPEPADATDALALALAHLNRRVDYRAHGRTPRS